MSRPGAFLGAPILVLATVVSPGYAADTTTAGLAVHYYGNPTFFYYGGQMVSPLRGTRAS